MASDARLGDLKQKKRRHDLEVRNASKGSKTYIYIHIFTVSIICFVFIHICMCVFKFSWEEIQAILADATLPQPGSWW